jgi:hypothetical protein
MNKNTHLEIEVGLALSFHIFKVYIKCCSDLPYSEIGEKFLKTKSPSTHTLTFRILMTRQVLFVFYFYVLDKMFRSWEMMEFWQVGF